MSFKLKPGEKYIFATDLDGTFLTNFVHSLHIDSYEAVQKIKENGHHFIIATGRSWWWSKIMYDQLDSVDASIHFSGAIVHHPNDKNFDEFRTSISQIAIKNLVKKLDLWAFAERIQAVGRKYHATWNKGDDLEKLFFNCYEYLIDFKNGSVDIDEIVEKISNIMGEGYVIRIWTLFGDNSRRSIIISPQKTNKGTALKKVSQYYNIPRENVIYFGDNINDLEALKWAGQSFAPTNATKEAKKEADEILELSCDEGAVPKKIIQLINEVNDKKN